MSQAAGHDSADNKGPPLHVAWLAACSRAAGMNWGKRAKRGSEVSKTLLFEFRLHPRSIVHVTRAKGVAIELVV